MANSHREIRLTSLEARIERRYPGIRCRAERCEIAVFHGEGNGVWNLQFFAKDRESLIRAGLATAEQFDLEEKFGFRAKCRRHPSNHSEFGDTLAVYLPIGADGVFHTQRVISDYDRMKYTKKLQAQVARILKPFIKGTWKAPPTQAVRP